MSLLERLKSEIAAAGPIGVADYMMRCLHDPRCGYYAARPAIGETGDFITAPMVSQMFGELIGLWAVETWRRLGAPARVLLAEAGPGTGTLMADALRAARLAPDFLAAAELWLIETSEPLTCSQKAALADAPLARHWIAGLADLPDDAPVILVANELLDCLAADQLVRTGTGWAERRVGLDHNGELTFGLAPLGDGPGAIEAPVGAVLELSPAQQAFGAQAGERVARQGGAVLLIDYGRAEPGFGDTLQALRRHEKVDPLACPGEADLTMHADFPAVLAAARAAGASTALLTQGEFLRRLGIEQRAAALARARPDQAARLGRQLERLIGDDQMGLLFKAACIHSAGLAPPGFEGLA
ncbi:MAG TPA: SAM-dependent methyltransferase [Caulobacteraceae bacterium]|jgi:SAM-dependent MidA family methyltransferase|nr:SAM-dependent methyltransferase [Caulobacteraceae bacterium]